MILLVNIQRKFIENDYEADEIDHRPTNDNVVTSFRPTATFVCVCVSLFKFEKHNGFHSFCESSVLFPF